MPTKKADTIIVGAGIAGLTAALYLLRAGKKVIIFENSPTGGRIALAHRIENYPGISSISGAEFAGTLKSQVENPGVVFINKTIDAIDPANMTVFSGSESFCAKSLIIAVGLKNRLPEARNTDRFLGKGISFCALCDGPLFKGREVCVLGGGNTALSEALYLSEICSKVYLIHRRNKFRAEKILADAVASKSNITRLFNTTVSAFNGNVRLEEVETVSEAKKKIIKADSVFSALGYIASSGLYEGIVSTDKDGFACTDETCRTDYDGIFIAGDCRKKPVRQLITAAADGASAALGVCEFLE